MKNIQFFNNRNALLITRHKKEEVIFPLLKPLGMQLSVLDTIDTDQFGSFTRDIQRRGTQLEAAQLKAKKALEVSGEHIAVSSEGRFGPHPQLFFVPANIELVLLIDTRQNIEIAGWEISSATNFSHMEVTSATEALRFSTTCGFPSHGLVVRPNQAENNNFLFKGLTDESILEEAVMKCIRASQDGKALIETDMRAMYNPTRMKVIEKATLNLLSKFQSFCPECAWPGFEITGWISGLPCENCFMPTRFILKHIYMSRLAQAERKK